MSSSNTKVILIDDFNAANIVFAAPKVLEIPNMKGVKYIIVPVSYINADKTVGDLCMLTEKLFTFGVSDPYQIGGNYTLGLSMFSRTGPTSKEAQFVANLELLIATARAHLETLRAHPDVVKNKLGLGDDKLHDFESRELKYPKCKATGEPLHTNPTMNVKLNTKFVNDERQVITVFTDNNDREISYLELVNKYGLAQCVLKFEGIFIGKNCISCQIKLLEAQFIPNVPRSKTLYFAIRDVDNDVVVDNGVVDNNNGLMNDAVDDDVIQGCIDHDDITLSDEDEVEVEN